MIRKILFQIILASAVIAQPISENDVIATIGNKNITVKEFKLRYELSPQFNRSGLQDSIKKLDLIYTLIAEKLWSLEAEKSISDTSSVMNFTFPAIEKMILRDALYSKEIVSNSKASSDEYEEYLRRSGKNVLVRAIHSPVKNVIDSIYAGVAASNNFDSLFAITKSSKNAYEIRFGDLNENVESKLYNLNAGQFSEPVNWENEWYIFFVDEIKQNNFATDSDLRARDALLRKVTEQRAIQRTYNDYYNKFFKSKKVSSDGYLFWSFANQVIQIIHSRINTNVDETMPVEPVKLLPEDFADIKNHFGTDSLAMPFISFEDRTVSLNEFLYDFFLEGFYTSSSNPDIIRAQLNSRVKYFIERELLSNESISKGLNNDPDVIFSKNMWRDNYAGSIYKNNLINDAEPTDEELEAYYNRNRSTGLPKSVNIVEILTDSLEIIERVLRQLDEGKTLDELAAKYTKRSWAKRNNGEFGFFPVTSYGEIGRLAGEMEIGQIMGPIETPDGYSIFQLIGKRDEINDSQKPFEEIKDELKNKLRVQHARNNLIDRTAELANKFEVSINDNLLNSVEVKNLSMFVYRYFGFGGRLPAVPILNPFTEWVKKWQESRKELP